MSEPVSELLPELELNDLLRRVDWRFLCAQEDEPLVADLSSGRDSRALGLVGRGEPVPGAADVAVTGFPTRLALGAARDAVRLGGEIVCVWRMPRPRGPRRAAARLRRAGLLDVRVVWPGPDPRRSPQFWLPLDSPAAAAHLLAGRPARSPIGRLLRALWRLAARGGLLAPVCAIGRVPGAEEGASDGVGTVLRAGGTPLLLTGGGRSINKVAALQFDAGGGDPASVVKFARVAAADEALEREAAALRLLERDYAAVEGVPRVLATGRRWGRLAVAESAINGRPLIGELSAGRFADLAARVGEWLTGLSGGEPVSPERWRERLVAEPLAAFERDFGALAGGAAARARELLAGIGPLPAACEHRDCSPWNVLLSPDGGIALLDWESAEPDGLPALDLVYFLANAAFVLDGSLESGETRTTYRQLLDPRSAHGAVFAAAIDAYCSRLRIAADELARLRLLCWIVHCRSDYLHLEMAAAGPPTPEALRTSAFLGLVEEELSAQGRKE